MILVYEDGTGYDLSKVVTGNNTLEAITDQGLKFFYHPCGDIKEVPGLPSYVENNCKTGYTLCMFDINTNKTVVLGTQSNMEFRISGDTMQVIFIINEPPKDGGQVGEAKESSIALECLEKDQSSVLYAPLEKIDPLQVVSNS